VFGEGHHPNASAISAGLGTVWETARIAVKAYAAMGLLHAGIDAALKLRSEKVPVDQIKHIEVDLAEGPYQHGGWQAVRPLQPIGAQMNIAYVVAVALLDGNVLIEQFADDRINRDDVWRLIDRTQAHHEESYDKLPLDEQLRTRVRLTLEDGTVREATVTHPRGTGDHLLSDSDIIEKYRSLTHSVISPERQAAIEQAVLGIDELDDISDLMALLTPMVESALG
jgi:aconitate decarboxylase